MKKLHSMILCFFLMIPSGWTAWELIRSEKKLKFWVLDENPQNALTYEELPAQTTSFQENPKALTDYIIHHQKTKQKVLSLIGIKAWTIKTYFWKTADLGKVLEIHGQYHDFQNQTINFREYHYFQKDQLIQVLWTSNESGSFEKDLINIKNFIPWIDP
jgi:hypothetical protein